MKIKLAILTIILGATTISSFAKPIAKALSVNIVGESPAQYQCDNGTKIIATYYQLSDKSLQFVKLKLDKKEVTLPEALAASGARYSDGYQFEWWIKGKNATLNKNVSDKNQKAIECGVK